MFAQYVDHVEDPREISGVSRFLSGGMGGIASQLSTFQSSAFPPRVLTKLIVGIYPIETMKASNSRMSCIQEAQALHALNRLK